MVRVQRCFNSLLRIVGTCITFGAWYALMLGAAEAMPRVDRSILSNGLVLLFAEEHSLPVVNFYLLIDAGSRTDPIGQEGVAHLTAKALLLGTSQRTASRLNDELDAMGAVLSSSCNKDYATLSLEVLKKDVQNGLALFVEVVTSPSFPRKELRREIERIKASIKASEQRPGECAMRQFAEAVFQGSPYGHAVEGNEHALDNLTRAQVRRFYRTYYEPGNSILVVVGDMTLDELRTHVIPVLEQWSGQPRSSRVSNLDARSMPEMREKIVGIDRPTNQSHIVMGHVGISRDNPDFYALSVMNYILGGGGFASRLFNEIRNRRGLAYSVSSLLTTGKYQGSFGIVLQTKHASAQEAIDLTRQEVERIRTEGVTDEELQSAKRYLTGSFPLRIDTSEELSQFLVQVEYYGLGLDYPEKYNALINALSKEDIMRVARTYLHPDACVLVVVGRLQETGIHIQ